MFGANDDNQQTNDDPAMLDNVKDLASQPAYQVTPAQPQFMTSSPQQPMQQAMNPQATQQPIAYDNPQPQAHQPIAEPAQGFSSSPMPEPPVDYATNSPMQSDDTANSSYSDDAAQMTSAPSEPINPDHLAGMKQQALEHLEPLIGHLDQSPEESFKTTMMMIQANDNHTLLEKALEQAKLIEDDKARANAMLDIINEINYFSQSTQE